MAKKKNVKNNGKSNGHSNGRVSLQKEIKVY